MPQAVPKPAKKGTYTLTCSVCGSGGFYTFQDMITHSNWCKAAKAKMEKQATAKKAKANRSTKRR